MLLIVGGPDDGSHVNTWVDTWVPAGLIGARREKFAADRTQYLSNTINMATVGVTGPAYILSLDQSKFFGHMDLKLLRDMCNYMGFAQGCVFLDIYAKMERQLFLEGHSLLYPWWQSTGHSSRLSDGMYICQLYCLLLDMRLQPRWSPFTCLS